MKPSKQNLQNYFPPKIKSLYQFFTIFNWVLLAFLVFKSFMLRPIADDYCMISMVQKYNIFQSTWWFYQNINGDIFSMFLLQLLVALPVKLFGIAAGSAFPFLILTFAASSIFILNLRSLESGGKDFVKLWHLVPLSVFSWLLFWRAWASTDISRNLAFQNNYQLLSEEILHWKTVQIQYLFLGIILIILATKLISNSNANNKHFAFFGLFLGISGYIVAVSISIYVFCKLMIKRSYIRLIIFLSATSTSMFFSFFSPGSQKRKAALVLYPSLKISKTTNTINFASEMRSLIFSQSFFTLLIWSFVFFILISCFGYLINVKKLKELKNEYIFLSIIFSLVTTIANYFVGWSPWHFSYFVLTLWLCGLYLGMSCGMWFVDKFKIKNLSFLYILLMVLVLGVFSALTISNASNSINSRYLAWNTGPAPTSGIEDREVDWVKTCEKGGIGY